MAQNPFHDPTPPHLRESVLDHLRRVLTSHLRRRAADAVIPDGDLQALHPLLVVPQVWQRIRRELGL